MTDYLTDAEYNIEAYFKTHEIPNYFYQCLFGELIKIYGIHLVTPDQDCLEENDDDYSYEDQIGYHLTMISGTTGWNLAFKETCVQCELTQLEYDYSEMDWVRSDIFDGYIIDNMLEVLFAESKVNDYYFFKENTK